MRIRVPPGRAGRIWLIRRLAVAQRGHDVLDQKRRALLRQLERLRESLDEARREWQEQAREAEVWWQRAAVLAGERPLALARASVSARADVTFEWRNSLGVRYPAEAAVALLDGEHFPAGSSSALPYAVQAHGRALEAAARLGANERAHARMSRELRATIQRLRAIERRWIPEHERALHALELSLDETEREEAARIRWMARRLETRATRA